MRNWSKLQSKLYQIMIDDFQIHVTIYKQNSLTASRNNKLPRYWITVGKDIVFDYPRLCDNPYYFSWDSDMSSISSVIEEYILCPKEELLAYKSSLDFYGIVDILKVCDKRIGKRRFEKLRQTLSNDRAFNILKLRENGIVH